MSTPPTGMILDGIGGSEAIDSSGEILDVKGADISSYLNGSAPINYEHRAGDAHGASANDVIGRVVYAKKIYGAGDCDDDRQKMYWNLIKLPYIYVRGRLFDGSDHPGAIAAAAMLRDAFANGEPPLLNWSVEGSTVARKDNRLESTVLRAIALTVKPCNKSAMSGLLEDPNAPKGFEKKPGKDDDQPKDILDGFIDRALKTESGDPLFQRLASTEHVYMPFEKALEAGNYNVPPSQLTGGSALSVEHLRRKKISDLTKQAKAAIRDWNKLDDARTFLKHRLPDASDEFLNHFADMANDWKLRKDEEDLQDSQLICKFEYLVTELITNLRKAAGATREVDYGGKKVGTGTATVGDSKYHVLEHQPGSHMVGVPEGKLESYQPSDLKKVPVGGFKLHSMPKYREEPKPVNALVHGNWSFNHSPEQHQLIHGLDLGTKSKFPPHSVKGYGETKKSWHHNAAGKPVFVKVSGTSDDQNFTEPHKEVAYHNLAKDFFGLGHYLPTVSFFNHPDSGKESVAIEGISGAQHSSSDHPVLKKLDAGGELDKLGIMDHILGNADRGTNNFLISNKDKLHLIDHGHAFDYDFPAVVDYFPGNSDEIAGKPLHPQAALWASRLDSKALEKQMRNHKIPSVYIQRAKQRLEDLQGKLKENPSHTRGSIGLRGSD